MKKILALVLAVCMILSASVVVFADGLLIAPAPVMGAPTVISGAPISRAEAVSLIWDDAEKPYVNYYMTFKDFKEGDDYYEAVRWATSNKITNGISKDNFGPEQLVTKEQFVTMLYRYAQFAGIDVSVGQDTNILSYEDVFETSKFAMEAFQWACGAGVTTGDDGYLYPKAVLTKVQALDMILKMNAPEDPVELGDPAGAAVAVSAGGWTLAESAEIPAEAQKAFDKAMEGFTGVGYKPIAYLGSQVVAGLNYAFLCKSKGVYPGAKESFSIVKVYAALDGSATITGVTSVAFP